MSFFLLHMVIADLTTRANFIRTPTAILTTREIFNTFFFIKVKQWNFTEYYPQGNIKRANNFICSGVENQSTIYWPGNYSRVFKSVAVSYCVLLGVDFFCAVLPVEFTTTGWKILYTWIIRVAQNTISSSCEHLCDKVTSYTPATGHVGYSLVAKSWWKFYGNGHTNVTAVWFFFVLSHWLKASTYIVWEGSQFCYSRPDIGKPTILTRGGYIIARGGHGPRACTRTFKFL